jgi:membrane protein YdbS with pleckstrin-like domain
MPKIDKIKEQIGWLKVVFGLLFATDISLIAYLFTNIEKLNFIQITLVLLGLLVVTLGILYTNKKAMEKIDSLEDL